MRREVQRCPSVGCMVHEAVACDVVARIEAVEVHLHPSELLGPVVGKRALLLIALASRALYRQSLCELRRVGQCRRVRLNERTEGLRVRARLPIDQAQ